MSDLIRKSDALALIDRKVGRDHPALSDELRHAIAALPAVTVGVKPDRETFDAMCAMRDAINEYVPTPSLESDLLQGPENSVFCATVAEAVIAEIRRLRAALEPVVAPSRECNHPYCGDTCGTEPVTQPAPDPAAIREAALREAHDAIADYPRVAPDATEAQQYDEQIEHSQAIILALIPKGAAE